METLLGNDIIRSGALICSRWYNLNMSIRHSRLDSPMFAIIFKETL